MKPEGLRKWRIENGYSQDELAHILGVHAFSVSRWECGTREIPPFLHLALKAIPKKGGEAHRSTGSTKSKRKEARHGTKRDL
jgi:DNA-binding XRE family transcriptional regulator